MQDFNIKWHSKRNYLVFSLLLQVIPIKELFREISVALAYISE